MRHNQNIFRLIATLTMFLTLINSAYTQRKPRVAVLNFTGPQGKRITDWAVVKLGESKVYTLLERDDADFSKVMNEIGMNQSKFDLEGLFDKDKKVHIGKVQGVEILVLGKVDTCKISKPLLGKILDHTPGTPARLAARGKWNAQVKILFKMINAATTQIMDSATVEGKANGSDIASIMDGKVDEEFANELLNRATQDAVGKFVVKLEQKAEGVQIVDEPVKSGSKTVASDNSQVKPNSPASPTPSTKNSTVPAPSVPAPLSVATDGEVVDVSGNEITIKVSPTTGIQPGDFWQIRRVSKVITDPTTGQELDRRYVTVGEVEITEVLSQTIVGKYKGTQPVQTRDKAIKSPPKAPVGKGAVKPKPHIKK
ncbi:MAG: CsgG/HfaB family protein [Acidobacteriota bacterium]|nr:CsgG/HfaB family protein [Acidobacteriota bacterium]